MADLSTCPPLSRESVIEARARIVAHVHVTPLLTAQSIDSIASVPQSEEALKGTQWEGLPPANPRIHFFFKCENLQRIGAFKARGGFNSLLRYQQETLKDAEASKDWKERGVVTHSSGNHAQAVALAARDLGIKARIVMPLVSMPNKIAAAEAYGAELVFSGYTLQEREAAVSDIVEKTGARFVPPFNHPDVLLGQGTLGLELQEQARSILDQTPEAGRLHAVILPCGGGGLLSGVATSCIGTGIKVFGAEPSYQGADDCRRGLAAGKRIDRVRSLTIADGLRTSVGEIPWSVISDRTKVAGVYAVTDEQIKKALRIVLERLKVVVEPSSTVPLAVALFNEDFRTMVEREASGGVFNLAVVFSGGNINLDAIGDLVREES